MTYLRSLILFTLLCFTSYILKSQQLYCANFKIVGVYDFPPSPQEPGGNYFLLMMTAKEDNPGISTGYANLFVVNDQGDTLSIPTGPNRHLPLYKSDTIPYTLKLAGPNSNQDFPTDFTGHLFIINSQQPNCQISFTNQVTGIEKQSFETHGLKIYPNPARDLVRITSTDKISRISIYNLQGKIIIDEFLSTEMAVILLDDWVNGFYFLNIQFDDGTRLTRTFSKH